MNEIPKKYHKLVGQRLKFKGNLFGRKSIPETEYDVIDIRPSFRFIVNMKTMEAKHPCFELLLKREGMRASRWSQPFPIVK